MKEIKGSIRDIREFEDCIRATKKYTEGLLTNRTKHPIQGEEFPSSIFCRYYEVYTEMEAPSWSMRVRELWDWLDTPAVAVKFFYNYRDNKASLSIEREGLERLKDTIPHFAQLIRILDKGNNYNPSKTAASISILSPIKKKV